MDFKYMEEQGLIDASLIDKWKTMDVGDEEEFEKWCEEMNKELEKDPNYMNPEDEFQRFYQDNCMQCGSQRCMGVYDKDWREGCELFKKEFSHISIDDSKESVIEETKTQNVLNIENKSYVMSVLEKMYDDWKEEQYGQLEIMAKNLDDEIHRAQQSLSDRIDKFEAAVWSRFSVQENPVPEKKQK